MKQINKASKRNNQQIIREIKQKCITCKNLYKLLEIHNIDIKVKNQDDRCPCLAEWKEILAGHHERELAEHLNNKENESELYDI